MVKNKTLFILGAGASSEVGMPAGGALKIRIAQLLNIKFENWNLASGDRRIFDALQSHAQRANPQENVNEYIQACRDISEAMPQSMSIDNFLEAHHNNKKIEICGKLAIVRSILEAEQNSRLYINLRSGMRNLSFDSLSESWFIPFIQLLTENCPLERLAERLSLISFVNFNYDRCLKHFVFHAIKNYYRISDNDAAELTKKLEVFHPYGTIGSLPWQKTDYRIDFGADAEGKGLLSLAPQIKTFAEGTDSKTSNIDAIRQKLIDARIVIFLGFAFHKQNMELLKPDKGLGRHHEAPLYYATALGNSLSNTNMIISDIHRLLNIETGTMQIRSDLTCYKLLLEYWRELAISFRG